MAGWQFGTGIFEITRGDKALGGIDLAEGAANLALDIGVPLAVKAGAVAIGGSARCIRFNSCNCGC